MNPLKDIAKKVLIEGTKTVLLGAGFVVITELLNGSNVTEITVKDLLK